MLNLPVFLMQNFSQVSKRNTEKYINYSEQSLELAFNIVFHSFLSSYLSGGSMEVSIGASESCSNCSDPDVKRTCVVTITDVQGGSEGVSMERAFSHL